MKLSDINSVMRLLDRLKLVKSLINEVRDRGRISGPTFFDDNTCTLCLPRGGSCELVLSQEAITKLLKRERDGIISDLQELGVEVGDHWASEA